MMLPIHKYRGVNDFGRIRYCYWPFIGLIYCRRVEPAVAECTGGESVLEVGFGTGLAFINLCDMYFEIHREDITADINQVCSVYNDLGMQTYLKKGDILSKPYGGDNFDTVLSVSIL